MDLSNRIGIVVDEPDHTQALEAGQKNLFIQLPHHGGENQIGGTGALAVEVVDMAAKAERELVVQSILPLLGSAPVNQESVAARDDDIGDNLLMGGVVFRFRAVQEDVRHPDQS